MCHAQLPSWLRVDMQNGISWPASDAAPACWSRSSCRSGEVKKGRAEKMTVLPGLLSKAVHDRSGREQQPGLDHMNTAASHAEDPSTKESLCTAAETEPAIGVPEDFLTKTPFITSTSGPDEDQIKRGADARTAAAASTQDVQTEPGDLCAYQPN